MSGESCGCGTCRRSGFDLSQYELGADRQTMGNITTGTRGALLQNLSYICRHSMQLAFMSRSKWLMMIRLPPCSCLSRAVVY